MPNLSVVVHMTERANNPAGFTSKRLSGAQLLAWIGLSTVAKVDFFEEMFEFAYRSGALSPERLALRARAAR